MTIPAEIQKVRSKGIGGSEVAAILGLDKYSSPYKVWARKTGREPKELENKYMRAGTILESAVAEFFQQETKYRIIKASAKQKVFTHPEYPFAIGMPDRFYIAKQKVGKGILECKATQMQLDEVIDPWFCQLQWYLGITGSIYGGVAWLERGLDFKYREYEYKKEFFDWMLGKVDAFWNVNVLKDVAPDPISVEDIQAMYERSAEGKTIEASAEMVQAHKRLKVLKDAIKEIEKESTQLEEQIKVAMRDAETISAEGYPLFTWKSTKNVVSFDRDSFQRDHPDMYQEYQKEKPGARRFLIK